MSQSLACRCLQNIDRIHKKILLPKSVNSFLGSEIGFELLTNLACAITLEKLSYKILINEVIKRILVMQTKTSFFDD